jgi:MFS family permease
MTNVYPLEKKTKKLILLSNLFNEPLVSLYPILPFILLKSLGASNLQIVLLTILKPVSAIFAFYWSERTSQNKQTLKMNLIGAGLLSRIPLAIALFFDNVSFFVLAATSYVLFSRALIPAWMEILKKNISKKGLEKSFSFSSSIAYAEGIFIAIGASYFLDSYANSWKIFFALSLVSGLIGLVFQSLVKVEVEQKSQIATKENFRDFLLSPWKNSWKLMKSRKDFSIFQTAFMIGGFGLMLIQPVIPIFFMEYLSLSYKDLIISYSVCKALGFVLSSSFWSRFMNLVSIPTFTALVLIGFGLFPFLILCTLKSFYFVYIAYFVYGIAQAGSHLIWHLSGPLFAREENSSRFSGVNIVMVGIRGVFGPLLGGVLQTVLGPIILFWLSSFLCFLSAIGYFANFEIKSILKLLNSFIKNSKAS